VHGGARTLNILDTTIFDQHAQSSASVNGFGASITSGVPTFQGEEQRSG
jgi:hypothetical protein